MSHSQVSLRVAGIWLAVASLLLAASLALHGAPATQSDTQMKIIAEGASRWVVVHWAAAAALSFFAVAGFVVLAATSRLTQGFWTTTAWAVLPVGALWTLTTAVAEPTVVASAAVSGNTAMFEAWWAFSEGKTTGFIFLALAVAVIAGNETRTPRAIPAWASWIAVAAWIASFMGWILGMWLEIAVGNLVWVVSSLVMCMWTLWFGVAVARTPQADMALEPVGGIGSAHLKGLLNQMVSHSATPGAAEGSAEPVVGSCCPMTYWSDACSQWRKKTSGTPTCARPSR